MRIAIVVLVACGGGGQSPPGPDGSPNEPFESLRFIVRLCTAGEPDDLNCPVNRVPIDVPTAAGAEVSFVVRPLATGVMFDRVEIAAGPSGLHIEHPQFLFDGELGADPYAEVVHDIAPGTVALDASKLIVENLNAPMTIRFDDARPFRP